MTTFPFEVPRDRLEADLDGFVDAIFSTLESEFLVLPRGDGFVTYPVFESAYQALKRGSDGFRDLDPQRVLDVALEIPLVLVVLRTMLGFTPPEWAYLASRQSGVTVSQGTEPAGSNARRAQIRSRGVHRGPWVRRAARRHEEAAARNRREGVHVEDPRSAGALHESRPLSSSREMTVPAWPDGDWKRWRGAPSPRGYLPARSTCAAISRSISAGEMPVQQCPRPGP